MSAREPQAPRPLGQILAAALLAGALAGAAAGVIDGLWSWTESSQFLHGGLAKLRFVAYLGSCYAIAGAILGAVIAAVALGYARHTRLGDLARAALRSHHQTRERDPREALVGLSLVMAALPVTGLVAGLGFQLAYSDLAGRKHMGLVVGASMVVAVLALGLATLLSIALARPIELGLRALGDRAVARLSSPWAPLVTALGLLLIAVAAGMWMAWDTLRLLPLRPLWVSLLAMGLALPAIRASLRWTRALWTRSKTTRRGTVAGVLCALIALTLLCGSRIGTIKAADRYSGLGGPLTRVMQSVGDLDRDGFSRILAGGDCDDWDDGIHPGAAEIPGDGIDQNCLGGDPTLETRERSLGFTTAPASIPDDFNVVLITIDTLRADHLGAYGYHRETSPEIDRVAAQGTLFRNGWAHAPSTRYSMPAILTGRLPLNVDYDTSHQGWPGLSPDNTTIAELLADKGVASAAVLNYWYFTESRRLNQGYDHYDNRNQRFHRGVSGKGPAMTTGSSSKAQTDTAIAMLDKFAATKSGQRFHLWVHYYDPHYSYERHPEVTDFGSGKEDLYDNEILFTDKHIGRLMRELRTRGLYDKTVVIITGDHGEGFGEHGIDLHGYHLYAAQTKVPFIIRVPGVKPQVVDTPVGHVDILPTVANLLGYREDDRALAQTDGRSLLAEILGTADANPDAVVFQQLSYENNHEMRAAVSRHCHAIFNVSPQTSWEIYRRSDDPEEAVDIVDRPGDCLATRRQLERWHDQAQIPAGARNALLPDRPQVSEPIDVDFGDEIRLLAVELPSAPIKSGSSFPVTYTYEARGALSGGWRVFAHFEGSGQRFQDDHQPPWPFAWWSKGQFVRHTRTVHVPKTMRPGSYRLWMGIFRKAKRRPARAGAELRIIDDRVLVGEVTIKR